MNECTKRGSLKTDGDSKKGRNAMHVTLICFPGDSRNQAAKDYLRKIPNLTLTISTSAKPPTKVDQKLPCAVVDSVPSEGLAAIMCMVDVELKRQEKLVADARDKEARKRFYGRRTQVATA